MSLANGFLGGPRAMDNELSILSLCPISSLLGTSFMANRCPKAQVVLCSRSFGPSRAEDHGNSTGLRRQKVPMHSGSGSTY